MNNNKTGDFYLIIFCKWDKCLYYVAFNVYEFTSIYLSCFTADPAIPELDFKEKTMDLQPIIGEEKQEMDLKEKLIHESNEKSDDSSSSVFVSVKQIPINDKEDLSNESSFETVPSQGNRLIQNKETNPVDPVFHGNPDPRLWPGV